MLRLGDLLDLDDNRFCPVMLRVAGDLPVKTHAHIDKHRGVRHLRIDPRRIEVHSVCTTYEGYVESENWFEYLRSEIAWQMAHWADIVPNERLGLLPTIGSVVTELTGYELIDNRSRPNFDFSRDRVFELLQGAGVYTSKRDALRELVQNAVDATLILAWLKHGEGEREGFVPEETIYRHDNPYGTKVQTILGRLPIGELSRSPFCPNREYMYSPFIVEGGKVTTAKLDELVNWTFTNRENPAVTVEEIRRCYQDFILLVDQAMSDEPSWASMVGYSV
jgi:hypothetical protein